MLTLVCKCPTVASGWTLNVNFIPPNTEASAKTVVMTTIFNEDVSIRSNSMSSTLIWLLRRNQNNISLFQFQVYQILSTIPPPSTFDSNRSSTFFWKRHLSCRIRTRGRRRVAPWQRQIFPSMFSTWCRTLFHIPRKNDPTWLMSLRSPKLTFFFCQYEEAIGGINKRKG